MNMDMEEQGEAEERAASPAEQGRRLEDEVRRSLGAEPRIRSTHGIRVEAQGWDVVLEGMVDDIASKKLALERAAATPDVTAIVDRLRVRPSTKMSDVEIRDCIRGELLDEPTLANLTLRLRAGDEPEDRPHPRFPDAEGEIEVRIADGVVTLDGDVPSLAHKRLAGALSWWVSGVSDVVNGLGVTPPEEDSDDEIVDALGIVFAKDRLLDSSEIQVSCRNAVIRLEGVVPTDHQKHMAEFDAWSIFGVDGVDNRLRVKPPN